MLRWETNVEGRFWGEEVIPVVDTVVLQLEEAGLQTQESWFGESLYAALPLSGSGSACSPAFAHRELGLAAATHCMIHPEHQTKLGPLIRGSHRGESILCFHDTFISE